jgi:hypothetical protein
VYVPPVPPLCVAQVTMSVDADLPVRVLELLRVVQVGEEVG